jgi:hypothetical protein
LDACGRLLEIMQMDHELDPFLARIKAEIDLEREGSMDSARQRANTERWVLEMAHELHRRQG